MAFRTNAGRGSNGHGVALFATTAGTGATQLVLTTAPGTGGASPYTVSPTPVVTAKSGAGVTDTSFVGVVTCTLNVLSGSPVLSGTTTKTAVAGVADFSANGLTVTGAGTWTLTFSSGSLSPAVSATGTTTSSAATKLTITTAPGLSGTTPYTLSPQPVVAAQNAGGATDTSYVTNVVASLNVLSGSPVLSGTTTKTPVSGVATFTDLVVTGTGTWTITFTSGSLTSATSSTGTTTSGAGSSITKLASVGVQGNTGTTTSGAIDTTGATLLVVGVSFYNLGPTPTVSDSKGNTWTALTASSDAGNNMHVKLFYCASPTVGTGHTFTINGTGIYGSLAAIAFSGTTASPFDVEHQHEAQGTITTVQPGSITPSLQHEVLVTGISHGQDGTTLSVDSGYTKEVDIASNAGGTGVFGVALAYLIQGAAAASNPTWTSSATANYLSSTIASFKATS